jgi:phage terminase large subunit-like protein
MTAEPRAESPLAVVVLAAGRGTRGGYLAKVSAQLGVPLMPWQQLVADVGWELAEDGRPAYREVVLTIPRQNGKTTLVMAWSLISSAASTPRSDAAKNRIANGGSKREHSRFMA